MKALQRRDVVPYLVLVLVLGPAAWLSAGALAGGCAVDGQPAILPLPDSASILFVSNRDSERSKEIYALDPASGLVTRLTFGRYHNFLLGLDRSGRYLAVSRATSDTSPPPGLGDEDDRSLWVVDLRTGTEALLVASGAYAEGDSFSPDGEWLVIHMRPDDSEATDLFKVRRDGSEMVRLTDTPGIQECDPTWSHDGTRIAFVAYEPTAGPGFVLKVMDAAGGNVVTIHDGGDGVATPYFPPGDYDPTWSPDDQWLAFERAVSSGGENAGAGVWHIYKVRADGRGLIDLSEAGGHARAAEYLPSFSSDGSSILFSSRRTAADATGPGGGEVMLTLCLMDADTGQMTELTDGRAWDDGGIWVPQGSD